MTNLLEAGALHLVLQKHVVLWRKPHAGPGGQVGIQQGLQSLGPCVLPQE